ncbi:hypothetical protein A0G02_16945 [Pectobacterium peruviense]|nr:hypothetical protein A0G02_16945 [Pectobacterium peruviense]
MPALIRSGRSNNGQESEKNHQSGRMTSYLSTEKVLKTLGLIPIYLKGYSPESVNSVAITAIDSTPIHTFHFFICLVLISLQKRIALAVISAPA